MKNFLQLKLGMAVGIDGMLIDDKKKDKFFTKKIFIIQFYSFFSIRNIYYILSKSNSAQSCKKSNI